MREVELFKKYEFKLVKKNSFTFFICIVSIILSIVAILSIQLTRKAFEESIEDGVSERNLGDIQIFSENSYFTKEQLIYLNRIKNIKDITFFNKELANIYTRNKIENVVFINWSNKEGPIKNNKIQLDDNIAKKLNILENEEILIKSNKNHRVFKVNKINNDTKSKIFSDNELELMEDILGVATTNGLDINNEKCNGAIINFHCNSNISGLEKELSKYLGNSFEVRTKEKLYNNIKNRLNFQIQTLNFIAIIAYSICGLSVMFTFIVINIKRERDFAIFKVLGIRKKQIVVLAFTESIVISIISIAIALPISIYCYTNISMFLFGKSDIRESSLVINIIRLVAPIIAGIVISSLVPMDIISNVPLMAVFRKEYLSIKNRTYMYRSMILILIPFMILSCVLLNSLNGIFITLRIVLLFFLVYTIIKLTYLLLSQIRRFIYKKYYVTFKIFSTYRKNLAISSMAYILSMAFILIFINSWGNLDLNKVYKKQEAEINKYSLEINESDEVLAEKLLRNMDISVIEKNVISKSQIKEINGKNINSMIKNRFSTSKELRADYYEYVKDLKVVWSDDKKLFPEDRDDKNFIIINTDFLNLLYRFKNGDIIKLGIDENNIDYKVYYTKIGKDKSIFGYINNCVQSTENSRNIEYKVAANNIYLYKLLEDIPSLHVISTGEMDEYINDFLDKYFEIFIIAGSLVIISAMSFLINGIQVHIFSKKKEILIFMSLGATYTDIYKIYILEGIVLGAINTFLAVMIGNKISKFLIENIAQKEYAFKYFNNVLFILLSIVTIVIIYWFNLKKILNLDLNRSLR